MDIRHIPSMRRNQVISDVFSRLGFMERRGSGIDRILNSYVEVADALAHDQASFPDSSNRVSSGTPKARSTIIDFAIAF